MEKGRISTRALRSGRFWFVTFIFRCNLFNFVFANVHLSRTASASHAHGGRHRANCPRTARPSFVIRGILGMDHSSRCCGCGIARLRGASGTIGSRNVRAWYGDGGLWARGCRAPQTSMQQLSIVSEWILRSVARTDDVKFAVVRRARGGSEEEEQAICRTLRIRRRRARNAQRVHVHARP